MIGNFHAPTSPPRARRRLLAAAPLAACGLLALAGCGSSKSSSTPSTETTSAPASTSSTSSTPAGSGASAGAQTLALSANGEGQFAYNTTSLSAKSGKVTIAFSNPSPIEHDVVVESASGERLGGLQPFIGGTKDLTVNLKAGTYKFYCSVPGHRQAGMEGTLTVQ